MNKLKMLVGLFAGVVLASCGEGSGLRMGFGYDTAVLATPSPTASPTATPVPTITPLAGGALFPAPVATPVPTPIGFIPLPTPLIIPPLAPATLDRRGEENRTCDPAQSFRMRVLEITNAFRAQNGLDPLRLDPLLSVAAQRYAERMSQEGFFDHTAPDGSSPGDRIAAAGYLTKVWGENIASGYLSPESAMQGWITSPSHRANLLNAAYTEIGLGYFPGDGHPYWVQEFTRP